MNNLDPSIVQRCRAGDKQAFRLLVEQYQQMVFSLAIRMLCDEEDAKDITQETFIRVWLNIGRYDTSQRLSTWIYTIASRLCLDRLRQTIHNEAMPEEEERCREFISDEDASSRLMNRELAAVIRTLVQKLSPKQRLVFTLTHLEGLESCEVEKITEMSAEQVKSNLYVARKNIREQLKRLGYEY